MAPRNEANRKLLKEEKLAGILRACQRMSGELELGSLLSTVTEEAAQLLTADRASIFLLDEENCELWSRVALGTNEELRFDARLGIAGEVAMNGATVIVDDVYQDPRFNPAIDARLGYRTRNIVAVPLRNRSGTIIGVFEALNRKSGNFKDEDAHILEELGNHAAQAAENALLFERLERDRNELANRHRHLLKEVQERYSTQAIVGTSRPIQQLVRLIEEISDSPIDVLITGESGTGKELVARAIHFSSERAPGPFVALNCSTLPENLVESELFGIEKGVATGVDKRAGRFEAAHGGTLFLDEIADLSFSAQAKILRALQERQVERVGGRTPVTVDVRILAATNKDLEQEISKGHFRDDLFYRLNVVHIRTPALREIKEDIPLLASTFLLRFGESLKRPARNFSQDALATLTRYDWPGNVRELENEMKRIAATIRHETAQVSDLSPALRHGEQSGQSLRDAVETLERDLIRSALKATGGNRVRASEALGLSRQGLLKKMQRYGIS